MEQISRQSSTNERPVLAAPHICAYEHLVELRSAIARLASDGMALPVPVEVRKWEGDSLHGRFVYVNHATCALHLGRGRYVIFDIERDLNGVRPDEARQLMLQRSGNVRVPDQYRSYAR